MRSDVTVVKIMAATRTRSDVKREAIICAAKQAFQEYGVAGTSMDKLAEIAQVSKRTVYNHFAAKEELVMHLLKELWQQTMQSVPVPYSRTESLHSQLSSLLLAEITLLTREEYLELARVAFGHFFYDPEKLRDEFAQLTAQQTVMHRWLGAANDDGRLCISDLAYSAKELSSLIKGHCFWPQLLKIEPTLSEDAKLQIASQTATLFLSHYATRPSDRKS